MTMKQHFGYALLGASLGAIGLASTTANAAEQITFVSQGGAYQQAQTVAMRSFAKQTSRRQIK